MRTPDFDRLYREHPDPFLVGTSWYERRKRAVVLASLVRPTYRLAWDVAAGTVHLASDLSSRCEAVVASDASSVAVEALTSLPRNVTALTSALPEIPDAACAADLAVVSEVLYYLDDDARAATVANLANLSAEIVCVQWCHHPDDAYISGPEADAELAHRLQPTFRRTVHHTDEDFILSTFVRTEESHP
nr:class I SAM-dependent methyltransferase [Actinomycetales bacterium]